MTLKFNPAPKRRRIKDCEACLFRSGDFFKDTVDPNVIRVYCKARHANVNAELMTDDCDFWQKNPDFERADEKISHFGL